MSNRRRTTFSLVAGATLGVPLALAGVSIPAYAAVNVGTWTDLQIQVTAAADTIVLTADITGDANENLSVDSGDSVTLDLAGFDLTVTNPGAGNAAFNVSTGATLTIIDSVGGSVVQLNGGTGGAGIGGDDTQSAGTVNLNGGDFSISGGVGAAGIGGGHSGNGGTLSIDGANVLIAGGDYGAGIGGGQGEAATSGGSGGAVNVTSGMVEAYGGKGGAGIGGGAHTGGSTGVGGAGGILIVGVATVSTNGGYADGTVHGGAGIGGGGSDTTNGGPGGALSVSGGDVEASSGEYAAGIGGGGGAYPALGGYGGIVTIVSGTVSADAQDFGAGIGGGYGANGGTFSINGGTVEASGGFRGAGIGGGGASESTTPGTDDAGDGGAILVSGGTVTAFAGSTSAAGIGGGSSLYGDGGDGASMTVTGGAITARGESAGVGGGNGLNPGATGSLLVEGTPVSGAATAGGATLGAPITNPVSPPAGVQYTASVTVPVGSAETLFTLSFVTPELANTGFNWAPALSLAFLLMAFGAVLLTWRIRAA